LWQRKRERKWRKEGEAWGKGEEEKDGRNIPKNKFRVTALYSFVNVAQ